MQCWRPEAQILQARGLKWSMTTQSRVAGLTSLMQASDTSMAMFIAAESTKLWTVSKFAEAQARTGLKPGTDDLTCDSVSILAKNSIRAAWSKSPVTAGEPAVGSVQDECGRKDTVYFKGIDECCERLKC